MLHRLHDGLHKQCIPIQSNPCGQSAAIQEADRSGCTSEEILSKHAGSLTFVLHGYLLQGLVVVMERGLVVLHGQGRRITVAAGGISPLGWLSVSVERPCGNRAQEQQTRGQNIP